MTSRFFPQCQVNLQATYKQYGIHELQLAEISKAHLQTHQVSH